MMMKKTRSTGRIEAISIQTTLNSTDLSSNQLKRKPHQSDDPKPQRKPKKEIKHEIGKERKPYTEIKAPKQHKERITKPQKPQKNRQGQQQNLQSNKNDSPIQSRQKQQRQKQIMQKMHSKIDRIRAQKLQRQRIEVKLDHQKLDSCQNIPDKKANDNTVLVDQLFTRGNDVKVYVDQKNHSFSVTFNQSDVSKNINKYYVMQILQSLANPDQYIVFTRWGRVGLPGNKAEAGPMALQEAIDNYRAKIQEKLQHGYKKIETVYENQRRNFYFPQRKPPQEVESKLDPKLQSLIKLIFDLRMINSQLKQIGYDFKKMPLGKIAQGSILKGYEALKEVMQELKKSKPQKQSLNQWSNRFYSNIPHDFGMKNISNFVLDSESKVKVKLELLQSIQDIQIYTKLIDEAINIPELNQLDANYLKLNYDIKTLQKESLNHIIIMKYVENTHASTHNHFKIEVDTIYQISEKGETAYKAELGNRHLLWHGSRLTNFVGILNQGLRIAPPQAPATGYMFGKGVYFADIVSKSANYCNATKINPIACLLLCEVALGNTCEKFYADYYANLLPQEYHSVKGVGKTAPKEGEKIGQNGEIFVPNGCLVPTGISNTSLQYNEYVVYDISQIKCRFLLKVKFVFK